MLEFFSLENSIDFALFFIISSTCINVNTSIYHEIILQERDVRWLSEVTEGGRLYYFPEDSAQSMWKLPSNPLDLHQQESLPSEDERSRASSCSLDHDASSSVHDDSLSSSGNILLCDPMSSFRLYFVL